MKFKTEEIKDRYEKAEKHPTLLLLLHEAEKIAHKEYGIELVMTCADRTAAETLAAYKGKLPFPEFKSPHEIRPLPAVDIRSSNFPEGKAREFAELINKRFTYDNQRSEKKCARFHDVGNGDHLHFQVCWKTVFNMAAVL